MTERPLELRGLLRLAADKGISKPKDAVTLEDFIPIRSGVLRRYAAAREQNAEQAVAAVLKVLQRMPESE